VPHRNELNFWSGRVDAADGESGRRWHQVVRPATSADGSGTALAGFACDAGVRRNLGRPGAAAGPRELRRMLGGFAWHGGDTRRLYDAGDVDCDGDALEGAQEQYANLIAGLLRAGHFAIGLGGGHEIAWASYQGAALALAGDARLDRLGVINFDAHLDLRRPEVPGRGTSGTPFLQIAESRAASGLEFRYLCVGASTASNTAALFDRAAALGADVILDVETDGTKAEDRIGGFIADCSAVYLTVCLDVLPAAIAPGVSAPCALGVPLHRAIALVRTVLDTCAHGAPASKLLMADVAELNPTFDEAGRTARTAARIVYEIASIRR
jgi:formiminoglutamase